MKKRGRSGSIRQTANRWSCLSGSVGIAAAGEISALERQVFSVATRPSVPYGYGVPGILGKPLKRLPVQCTIDLLLEAPSAVILSKAVAALKFKI
jgi:hypothetical protein